MKVCSPDNAHDPSEFHKGLVWNQIALHAVCVSSVRCIASMVSSVRLSVECVCGGGGVYACISSMGVYTSLGESFALSECPEMPST